MCRKIAVLINQETNTGLITPGKVVARGDDDYTLSGVGWPL